MNEKIVRKYKKSKASKAIKDLFKNIISESPKLDFIVLARMFSYIADHAFQNLEKYYSQKILKNDEKMFLESWKNLVYDLRMHSHLKDNDLSKLSTLRIPRLKTKRYPNTRRKFDTVCFEIMEVCLWETYNMLQDDFVMREKKKPTRVYSDGKWVFEELIECRVRNVLDFYMHMLCFDYDEEKEVKLLLDVSNFASSLNQIVLRQAFSLSVLQ